MKTNRDARRPGIAAQTPTGPARAAKLQADQGLYLGPQRTSTPPLITHRSKTPGFHLGQFPGTCRFWPVAIHPSPTEKPVRTYVRISWRTTF
ncbi:hypothetical protein C4K09_4244 [Pseudomonas chlororaphis subsp. aureofaciens]|uniref:Uncharacterized protein n=1 Tax=Pseudomonas chlororaphis subsp. aureofaciens TaxID=587851 RepID=A0AAD1E7J5_9PSED|nr:hypothetical protein C4K09_4244 [Pseudomonas chlororaphis subsp. aureofaciens]AZE25017.1 hypothetical protein C4K08_4604 [Pseudomonas chlororaphis subsp. aureofaciens]AZE31218.1 hypothetical protein C4K07_4447 [Pseudomonas chlororaphis subsp. aureofaciens]